MLMKKSSRKGKQRRPSYLFCCFNGSVMAESGDLEKPATAIEKVRKKGVSCFYWSWLRRKKKPLKDVRKEHGAKDWKANIILNLEKASNEHEIILRRVAGSHPRRSICGTHCSSPNVQRRKSLVAVKIYSSRSIPPPPPDPTKFSAAAATVNKEPYLTRLPLLTPKYDAQTRPESSNLRTEPVLEPDQQAATPFRVSTPARSEWAGKLDPKAGLTVIGVTLVVMVFYGRAAAVVSLCACFYLAAILRTPAVAEVAVVKMAGAGDADVDSEEYKKRVVLEGLLDRSKQRVQGQVDKI